ncbi:unnamed protein product [Macrosiphum euphorbiae]|uniref:HAT C-terminal dimerisation domain-containing protein n=1 Tax=Macrosiphum euphorbiae TaxID=13131 RepID=A0AAV0Y651_9HEMI|nr:unnamed protein product [Macrosiphum euphorbiae]
MINKCKEELKKDVFAIVTDNENKMKRMKQLLQEKYPDLVVYGCSAHYVNLIEKEVTPKTVMKHIVEVQKYFRNVHQAHGWLREKKGLMPQIPNETRWSSHSACVRTFVSNYHLYRQISTDNDDFDNTIEKILNNVGIYREALNLQDQLISVSNSLDRFQSDSTSISDSVDVWKKLLVNENLLPYKHCFIKRYKQVIEPYHFLAYMLDPQYIFQNLLTPEEESVAEDWIISMYPHFFPAVMAFKIQDESYFPKTMFNSNILKEFKTVQWWRIMEKKCDKIENVPNDFCKFLISLHSCPASSASIERIFSTYGLVWSDLRNRLGSEKAQKLVKVYRNLSCTKSQNQINYTED